MGFLRQLAHSLLRTLGFELRRLRKPGGPSWFVSPPTEPAKAKAITDRFREIISDPINTLIERDPLAGVVLDGHVKLHTGTVVPVEGRYAYHERFSEILTLNRGVHEPLEEFVFQELLKRLPAAPTMLELGAYWGHYSMWMKAKKPDARVYLVEPEAGYLEIGRRNFKNNRLDGEFVQAKVAPGEFEVDAFLDERGIAHLDVLHSDIQGAEVAMLEGCKRSLSSGRVSYCIVSTHSQDIHRSVMQTLAAAGYRIEASADYDNDTTSYDGLVFAASRNAPQILRDFKYLGRKAIGRASPADIVAAIDGYLRSVS